MHSESRCCDTVINQGHSQEFVKEGDKTVGSVTSGSGAQPQNTKISENLIECHKFHSVQTKNVSVAISKRGRGHAPSPLPHAPVLCPRI